MRGSGGVRYEQPHVDERRGRPQLPQHEYNAQRDGDPEENPVGVGQRQQEHQQGAHHAAEQHDAADIDTGGDLGPVNGVRQCRADTLD